MGKIVDGVELLRMIRDGEIKDKTKINRIMSTGKKEKLVYETYQLRKIYKDESKGVFFKEYNLLTLKDNFEILSEEDEEIDIQSIEHKELDILQEVLGKCDLWQGNEDYILKVINENNNRLANAILKVSNENKTILKAIKQLDRTMKGTK